MKTFGKLLGLTAALFFSVVFLTGTFAFIKTVWFGGGGIGSRNRVAVVDLTGMMLTSSSFVHRLEGLRKNSRVKAVVVRINSPGGIVAPSQEIYQALKTTDAKIPVVATMGSVGASGGYYAALGARKIFANPGTLTASIGVIIEFMNLEKIYQWARVERFSMTAGRLKSMGTPFRTMRPDERIVFENLLTNIHGEFRSAVKERRKLSDAELDAVADGRVMTGSQAKTAKLVDELGGFEDAVREAKKLAGLPETTELLYDSKKSGLLRELLLGEDDEPNASTTASTLASLAGLLGGGPAGYRILLLAPIPVP